MNGLRKHEMLFSNLMAKYNSHRAMAKKDLFRGLIDFPQAILSHGKIRSSIQTLAKLLTPEETVLVAVVMQGKESIRRAGCRNRLKN